MVRRRRGAPPLPRGGAAAPGAAAPGAPGRASGLLTSQRPAAAVGGKKRRDGSWRCAQVPSAVCCCSANSTRPSLWRRATIRATEPPASASGLLTSQRPAAAVGGNKRRDGSWRCAQVPSAVCCCSANSTRPSLWRRATIRATTSPASARSCASTPTGVTPSTANAVRTTSTARHSGLRCSRAVTATEGSPSTAALVAGWCASCQRVRCPGLRSSEGTRATTTRACRRCERASARLSGSWQPASKRLGEEGASGAGYRRGRCGGRQVTTLSSGGGASASSSAWNVPAGISSLGRSSLTRLIGLRRRRRRRNTVDPTPAAAPSRAGEARVSDRWADPLGAVRVCPSARPGSSG